MNQPLRCPLHSQTLASSFCHQGPHRAPKAFTRKAQRRYQRNVLKRILDSYSSPSASLQYLRDVSQYNFSNSIWTLLLYKDALMCLIIVGREINQFDATIFTMNFDDRVKLDIFCGSTTYINDYHRYPPQKRQIYKWEKQTSEPLPKKCSKYIREDHETFRPWNEKVHVPFDLLWEKGPILRTNPWIPFNKNLQEPIDTGKDEAIKTRPRLYMCPAVSLDDVPDKDMRALLCRSMYTTDWRRSEMEAVAYVNITKRDTADSVLEGGGSFQPSVDQFPPLPDGWRDLYEKWDKKQKRNCVDSTKTFWLHTPLIPDENPLEKLVLPETKTKISELVKENRLRQLHDLYAPCYDGYKVRLPKGVSLAKNDFPVVHPELSVAQAIAKRNEGDVNVEKYTCENETA